MKLMKIDEIYRKKKFILFLSLYISLLTAQMCHFFVHDFCKERQKQTSRISKKLNIKKVNCVLEFLET